MDVFRKAFEKQVTFFNDSNSVIDLYLKALISADSLLVIKPLPAAFCELDDEETAQLLDEKLREKIVTSSTMYFTIENKLGNRLGKLAVGLDSNDKAIIVIDELLSEKSTKDEVFFTISKWFREIIGISDVSFQGCLYEGGQAAVEEKELPRTNIGEQMILTAGPSISAMESAYCFDAAKNGWNRNWAGYLSRFEKEFAEYIGADYALATSSCTGALQTALMALDIGAGDEVIVPDQTWVATANAVRYAGAVPVFADIELDSWNIDAKSIEGLITDKTKAIMPVHMYGHPARMNNVMRVAQAYGLHVIEDAAPAIGAEWQGKRCGTFGDFAGFSFQGAKLLVTGEGGMLVTSNGDLYAKAKKIWDQGRNPNKVFWIDAYGVKFKMSNVQAAVGLGQIQRADELIEMKRRIFSWYEKGLGDVTGLHLNKEVEGAKSIYWMSSIFLDDSIDISRDELIMSLRDANVDTRPVFPAISQYPIWPRVQVPQPTALRVGQRAMNLPSGVCLKKDEVMYACEKIREILGV